MLAFSAHSCHAPGSCSSSLERASIGFKQLRPQVVSMYDEHFWRHERHWKFSELPLIRLFKGTPFKNVISRLLGVRLGQEGVRRRLPVLRQDADRGRRLRKPERGSTLQGHSLEEGVFKSDYIKIGSECSIGCDAFVHYGVTMGDNVVLDPDSFLMKGETVEAHAHWRGNPAKAVGGRQQRSDAAAVTAPQQEAPEAFAFAKAA